MMINKWLLRKTSGNKFNTDRPDTHSQTPETELDDENVPEISQEVSATPPHRIGRSLFSERSVDGIGRVCGISIQSSNRPRPLMLRENTETPSWTQYFNTREYKILVTTWNVGGVIPPSDLDLEDCLNLKEASDIYVLGFQEIVPLNAGNVLGSEARGPAKKWENLIGKTLNKIPSGSEVTPMRCSAPLLSATPTLIHLRRTNDNFPASKIRRRSDDWCSIFPCSCRSLLTNELLDDDEAEEKPLLNERLKESRDIERYNRVASKQMVGIYMSVWVRSELRRYIRDIQLSSVACGIMGRLGNKGSVSVRMCLHHTTLCFICSHLAAGEKEGDELRRNSQVSEIMKRTHFPLTATELFDLPQTITGHDRVIWFGDLNYRLASASPGITMSMIHKEDWQAILEYDQLKMEQAAGRVFEGWGEGSIAFAPTYKYAANSDQYSAFIQNTAGHKRRNPAWCDRILWFGKGLKQLSYTSGECRLSDHRPVTAVLLVDVQVLVSHRQIQKRVVTLDDDPRNLTLIL